MLVLQLLQEEGATAEQPAGGQSIQASTDGSGLWLKFVGALAVVKSAGMNRGLRKFSSSNFLTMLLIRVVLSTESGWR